MRLETIQLNGKEWKYRIEGNGSDLLLFLPGALGSGDLIAKYVSTLLPDVKVLVPEYFAADSVNEFLRAFEEMVSKEGVISPKVYGGSFGGLLAQCWVRKHPDTPVLILSGAGFPDPQRVGKNRFMLRLLSFIPIALLRTMMSFAARKIAGKIPENSEGWLQELRSLTGKIRKEDLESRYKTALDFDSDYRFETGDLQNSPMKILLIEGSKDSVAGKSIRDGMRTLYPHASVITIEGGGHSTMLTHPKEWAAAVNRILSI